MQFENAVSSSLHSNVPPGSDAKPMDAPEPPLGSIGFDQRRDYAAVGPVTNLASRLCAEATAGQVLVPEHLHAAVRDIVDAERLGPRRLKGFAGPVELYSVRRLTETIRGGSRGRTAFT